MQAVLTHPELFKTGLEDASVAKALALESVPITHTERIRPSRAFGYPKDDNSFLSGHGFSPEALRTIMQANTSLIPGEKAPGHHANNPPQRGLRA
jgi:hypothetical protein